MSRQTEANLAISFAQFWQKRLLIDAHIEKSGNAEFTETLASHIHESRNLVAFGLQSA